MHSMHATGITSYSECTRKGSVTAGVVMSGAFLHERAQRGHDDFGFGRCSRFKSTETALTSLCIHGRSRVVGGGFIAATEV